MDPALVTHIFDLGPAAFDLQDLNRRPGLETADAVYVGGPVALLAVEVQVIDGDGCVIGLECGGRRNCDGRILRNDFPGV